jgi:hypothetical protein
LPSQVAVTTLMLWGASVTRLRSQPLHFVHA